MTDIVWEDPPEQTRGRRSGEDPTKLILAELQARPGKWALISEDITRQMGSWWRKKGCEARAIANGKGEPRCKLYVRWPA